VFKIFQQPWVEAGRSAAWGEIGFGGRLGAEVTSQEQDNRKEAGTHGQAVLWGQT